jgi:DNA repair protein REV1
MAQFGGQYEQYYNTNVTHYICTNLAESKLKQFANTKDPPHFVQPSWITDCVQAGTLLSTKDYFVANRNTNNKSITSLLGGERVGLKEYQKNSRLHTIGTYKSKHDHEDTIDEDVGEFMSKFIVHIDMDCFFASVAMRDDPSLCHKPIAVSHATMGGSGDISSCNYVARQFGVKASMWTGQAKQICPELVIVPYELQKYESIADTMNNILFEMCGDKRFVRVTSIDEAYLDLTTHCNNESRMAEEMVKRIRDKILSETGCPCSAGISHNTLLAKLATRCAKPNGQYYLNNDENTVKQFFIDKQISLRDIPGIGRKKHNKLSVRNYLQTNTNRKYTVK